jgi:hypothetical protein
MVFLLFVPKLKSFFTRNLAYAPALASAGAIALFLWICSQFYLPGEGFTYLVQFGSLNHDRFLPELRAVNHFELPNLDGYDGQYYAQIAMRPALRDPELADAVDSLPYRARRILLCWTAYALAGGNPVRALHIFAVQNLFCWLGLAVLLWRWFPPTSWGNWARWAGVLFSFGLCTSVRGSLVDGPSLLLIAGAVALVESGRPWLGAGLLGLSGLAKDTNLLAAAALVPAGEPRRRWGPVAARIAVAALPLAAWTLTLWRWLGPGGAGARNFGFPLGAYWEKWASTIGEWESQGFDFRSRGDFLVLVALTTQVLFIVLRPRWREVWWRIGAAYAVLMVFLGAAVWEGFPGAAPRVLLPLTLAFNVLVPRRRAWWIVLLLGNLSVLVSPDALPFPGRESYVVNGPRALRIIPESGRIVEAVFDAHWEPPEKSWLEYYRWSRGSASVALRNPHPFAITADISFALRTHDARAISVRQGGSVLWSGALRPDEPRTVILSGVRLDPGDTVWQFSSDTPPLPPSQTDGRERAFSIRNLNIVLRGRADGP